MYAMNDNKNINYQSLPNQLIQVKQLGLLNDSIDNIIDSYLPAPDDPNFNIYDSKRAIAKITAENLVISNQSVSNYK